MLICVLIEGDTIHANGCERIANTSYAHSLTCEGVSVDKIRNSLYHNTMQPCAHRQDRNPFGQTVGRISCFILLAFLFLGHHIEAIYHVEHYVARLRVDPCFGATLGIHSVLHVADLLQDVYGIEAEGKVTL